MPRRVERKLQEVVVAQYTWRHEAEFAAGFLSDAGIPYRLQIDDPSLGLSVSSAATLWVVGADEARARDVLDLNEQHAPRLSSPRSPNHPARTKRARTPRRGREDRAVSVEQGRASPERMSLRTRAISILGGMGVAGLGRVVFGSGVESAVAVLVAAVSIALIVTGIAGWAPRMVRDFLDAVAGSEP